MGAQLNTGKPGQNSGHYQSIHERTTVASMGSRLIAKRGGKRSFPDSSGIQGGQSTEVQRADGIFRATKYANT